MDPQETVSRCGIIIDNFPGFDGDLTTTNSMDYRTYYEEPLYTEINIPLPPFSNLPSTTNMSPVSSLEADPTSNEIFTRGATSWIKYPGGQQEQCNTDAELINAKMAASRSISHALGTKSLLRRGRSYRRSSSSPTRSTTPSSYNAQHPRSASRRHSSPNGSQIHRYTVNQFDAQRNIIKERSIEALAVVPVVLVLSAELFTPGEGQEVRKEAARVEDKVGERRRSRKDNAVVGRF